MADGTYYPAEVGASAQPPCHDGDGRPFDKQAWAERKRQEREDAFARADAAALRVNSDPLALESYLRVAAALPHHSATNVLLIADRLPTASRVGTAEHWRLLGASIKRGQKAISIIEPSKEFVRGDGSIGILYDVRKVFDVTQTTMRPSPPKKGYPLAALESLIASPPVRLEPVGGTESCAAEYDHSAGLIRIQRGIDESQLVAALTTEYAHAWLARGVDSYNRDANAAKADLAAGIVARRLWLGEPAPLAPPAPPGSDARQVRQALEEVNRAAYDVSRRAQRRERTRCERGDAR